MSDFRALMSDTRTITGAALWGGRWGEERGQLTFFRWSRSTLTASMEHPPLGAICNERLAIGTSHDVAMICNAS